MFIDFSTGGVSYHIRQEDIKSVVLQNSLFNGTRVGPKQYTITCHNGDVAVANKEHFETQVDVNTLSVKTIT